MKEKSVKTTSASIWLKNISAGRKVLWNRILIFCGSALALYQFITLIMEQEAVSNLLDTVPYFNQYAAPVLNNILVYLAVAIVFAFLKQSSFTNYSKKIKGTDIEIGVKIGNIFDCKGGIIVPSNNTFIHDTDIIGTKSIQAQIAFKCADGTYTSDTPVEEQIRHALNSNQRLIDAKISVLPIYINGKTYGQYQYGTVVPVTVNAKKRVKHFYFLAMSKIDNPQIPITSDMELSSSIETMWQNVNELTTETSVVSPVIATGAARFFEIPAEVIARYILKTFANYACSKNVRINQFTLIINPNDYLANKYDIQHLHQYIDYLCDFPHNETEIIKTLEEEKLK